MTLAIRRGCRVTQAEREEGVRPSREPSPVEGLKRPSSPLRRRAEPHPRHHAPTLGATRVRNHPSGVAGHSAEDRGGARPRHATFRPSLPPGSPDSSATDGRPCWFALTGPGLLCRSPLWSGSPITKSWGQAARRPGSEALLLPLYRDFFTVPRESSWVVGLTGGSLAPAQIPSGEGSSGHGTPLTRAINYFDSRGGSAGTGLPPRSRPALRRTVHGPRHGPGRGPPARTSGLRPVSSAATPAAEPWVPAVTAVSTECHGRQERDP